MRKILAGIGSTLGFLTFAPTVFAQTINTCPEGQFSVLCDITSGDFGDIVSALITFAFILAVIIALAYLIYGGIKWITSGGDKSKVESARSHIVAAIIGLVIVLLVYFILTIVIGIFIPGFDLNKLELPSI